MNPIVKAIKERRSVRCYRSQPVPRDLVEAVIDAGNWAPTGGNLQRWRFVVAEDARFRKRLLMAARPTWKKVLNQWLNSESIVFREALMDLHPRCLGWPRQSYEETLSQALQLADGIYWGAPVVIFVIGTAAQECAMVCQNMMLAAHSFGLGTCIVGFGAQVTGDPAIVEALELQQNERIYGPVVVGYPKTVPEPPAKRDPMVKWI